MKRTKLEPRKL